MSTSDGDGGDGGDGGLIPSGGGKLTRERTPSLMERARSVEDSRRSHRNWLFFGICMLELLVNFDNGSLPASLVPLRDEYGLSFFELGLLGALVYLGLVLSCPVTGVVLMMVQGQERWVLVGSVALNAVAVLMMAIAPNAAVLMVGRALVGFAQAPVIIFAPVWVDEFAPQESMTGWISLLQANVAIGIMFGYLAAGLLIAFVGPEAWRFAFYFQAAALAVFIIIFIFLDDKDVAAVGGLQERLLRIEEELLDAAMGVPMLEGKPPRWASSATSSSTTSSDDSDHEHGGDGDDDDGDDGDDGGDDENGEFKGGGKRRNKQEGDGGSSLGVLREDDEGDSGAGANAVDSEMVSVEDGVNVVEDVEEIGGWLGIQKLLQSRRFVLLTFGLSGLYFVVTGIQFFITIYMVEDLGMPEAIVVGAFAGVSLTGPTAGVFFGGWLIDRMGGYREITDENFTGPNPVTVTLRTCTMFGVGAVIFAMPAAFVPNPWVVLVCIWLVLFFGGALVPAMTGVVMTAVDPSIRTLSNSVSMLAYNVLGYAAAPFVCGLIASESKLAWGFRAVLLVSLGALLPIAAAWFLAEQGDSGMTCPPSICPCGSDRSTRQQVARIPSGTTDGGVIPATDNEENPQGPGESVHHHSTPKPSTPTQQQQQHRGIGRRDPRARATTEHPSQLHHIRRVSAFRPDRITDLAALAASRRRSRFLSHGATAATAPLAPQPTAPRDRQRRHTRLVAPGSLSRDARRRTSVFQNIGDISAHVSRGRTLTSFYHRN